MHNIVIIPIGGTGERMKSNTPKQFSLINNQPLFIYTVKKFQQNENISQIVIGCMDKYKDYVKSQCEKYGIDKLWCITKSGKTQLETIFNAINEIKDELDGDDKIIIHVGNRPNISNKIIDECINKSNELGPVATYINCVESMIDTKNNSTVDRNNIIKIQTPQVYSFKDIEYYVDNSKKYYDKGNTLCDLFVLDKKKINYIKGEISNFKITYKEDYDIFKLIVDSTKKGK